MITRRSALIAFASAALSGSVYAQDQVTGGRPGSLAFKITWLPAKSGSDELALMASYGDGDDQRASRTAGFAILQVGRDPRGSFPNWAKPWKRAILAFRMPNRTR